MPKQDTDRERRIIEEIVVDAYGAEERAMSWYNYLHEQLRFPFTATCIAKRSISPLRVNDEIDVIRMPAEDVCAHEIFVTIRWEKRSLAVPLAQLKPIPATDSQTTRAVADWHYWVRMRYEF
ncbi:MAG: calcium-binding protein [Gemmatimonadaceae bacterium]|nr:calcium-binding protein [Gemmatimonadaceae bacterium]